MALGRLNVKHVIQLLMLCHPQEGDKNVQLSANKRLKNAKNVGAEPDRPGKTQRVARPEVRHTRPVRAATNSIPRQTAR